MQTTTGMDGMDGFIVSGTHTFVTLSTSDS